MNSWCSCQSARSVRWFIIYQLTIFLIFWYMYIIYVIYVYLCYLYTHHFIDIHVLQLYTLSILGPYPKSAWKIPAFPLRHSRVALGCNRAMVYEVNWRCSTCWAKAPCYWRCGRPSQRCPWQQVPHRLAAGTGHAALVWGGCWWFGFWWFLLAVQKGDCFFVWANFLEGAKKSRSRSSITHSIHVWYYVRYIYLRLVDV